MNPHRILAVLCCLAISVVTALGATGRRISDYTETLTVSDAWVLEVAVPGVTNYKATFGAMATNIIARAVFTTATSNSVIATVVSLNTNKADNYNGLVTNLTSRGLKLPAITAARPLYIDASGNITNVTGTPDGTKYVRDDGTLAVPPGGGGDVSTAQLNTASNFLYTTETTRNAAVSNGVLTVLIANDTTTSNGLYSVETTRNAAVSNSVVTLLVANDTTTSNGLYAVETTRNAAVSNVLVTIVGSHTQMVVAAIGTLTLTNALNVGTLNVNTVNLTNALGSNVVRMGQQDLTNSAAVNPSDGDVLAWKAGMKKWTNVLADIDVVSNLTASTTANMLLDLSLANVFKIRLFTNFSYTFTNVTYLTKKGYVYFQQDTVGGRLLNSYGVDSGVLQTNANMQCTTNSDALDLMEVMPGFLTTNLVAWWPQNFQPRVPFPGSSLASFHDNFDRTAANPLGTIASGGGTWTLGPGAFETIQGAFNTAFGTAPTYCGARVLTPIFAVNQAATVTLGGTGAELLQQGPAVRMTSASVGSCYAAWAESGLTNIRVWKITDTGTLSLAQLGSDYLVATLMAGDVIKLSATGTSTTTLTLYVNNVAQGAPINDSVSPLTAGQPGIFLFDTVHYADEFSATDL